MDRDKKDINCHQKSEEETYMLANTVTRTDISFFDEFLKINKEKINLLTPKNPSISKDDEWYNEDFWENDCKEK